MKEPKASPAKVAYHLKHLRKAFPRASDQQLLQMIWAIPCKLFGRAFGYLRFLRRGFAAVELINCFVGELF